MKQNSNNDDSLLIEKAKNGADLAKMINQAIDSYNSRRPHTSLNFKTPNFMHQKTEAENLLRSN